MSQPHLLIVDDARDIREPLGQYLRKHDYRVTLAQDAPSARQHIANGAFDLVVLDIMMPGEDGLSLCRYLREQNGPPVILLTAMADETDKIVGLEIGADDYVVKPFNPRELLARIRSVLRRSDKGPRITQTTKRRFGKWLHDGERGILTDEETGTQIELTSAENRLLIVFLDRPRALLSRDQLLDLIAGREAKVYDRAIDNHISRLRRKIETNPKQPALIVTEWGGGYRFASDVIALEGDQP